MSKRIELTQGQCAIVDDEDFEWLNETQYKWQAHYNPITQSYYAFRHSHKESQKQKYLQMHRMIMGVSRDKEVDHKNHDTLDNRKENLRIVTRSQNQANSRRRRDNTSGFKGVDFKKSTGAWRARINCQKESIFLGEFGDKIEAAKAYNRAAKAYHGEYAKLNEISEGAE